MSMLEASDYQVSLADDVRLNVRHLRHKGGPDAPQGAGAGLTLVLLHESLGTIALWRDFPEQLAQATSADVLVYERRGYGGSTPEPLPRPNDYLEQEGALWLPRLIEALALEKVVLVGHSDGGSIALITAATVAVRGLVTIAAHTFVDHLTLQGIREAGERYRTTDLARRLARYHGDRTDGLFNAWQETWQRESFAQSMDFSPWLAAIECPALILQGEHDEYGLPEQVTAIVEGIGPTAKAVFVDDAAHVPHLQQPEAVLNIIREFVAELSADRSEC